MKRTVYALVSMFAVGYLVAPVAAEAGGRTFTARDVDGPTAFAFDGFVTVPTPAGPIVVPAASTGRFTADGVKNLTDGARTLVVGGVATKQEFTCTYFVEPNGTGNAICKVTPSLIGAAFDEETFDFVIVESKKEAFFTATTPGATLRGATKRQH